MFIMFLIADKLPINCRYCRQNFKLVECPINVRLMSDMSDMSGKHSQKTSLYVIAGLTHNPLKLMRLRGKPAMTHSISTK